MEKKINTRPPNQTGTVFSYVFKSACCCFNFKTIPDIPPKPGELRTELRGYKVREEAAAAFEQLKAQQKVDWWTHPLWVMDKKLEATTCLGVKKKNISGTSSMDIFLVWCFLLMIKCCTAGVWLLEMKIMSASRSLGSFNYLHLSINTG